MIHPLLIWLVAACELSAPPMPSETPQTSSAQEIIVNVPPEILRDRRAWCEALEHVTEGMLMADVEAILGRPDLILSSERSRYLEGRVLWCYGTNALDEFPTLGMVTFDQQSRVSSVDRKGLWPLFDRLPPERKLRPLLRLINQLPHLGAEHYDPLNVIQVVNALQPLGKETALAVIFEYLRVSPAFLCSAGRIGTGAVCLTLFDISATDLPVPTFIPGPPVSQKGFEDLRTFPFLIQEDVPFLVLNDLGGRSWPAARPREQFFNYFLENGHLRRRPLQPSLDLARILDDIKGSQKWPIRDGGIALEEDIRKAYALKHVLRLVRSVYVPDYALDDLKWSQGKEFEKRWNEAAAALAKLNVHWSPARNCFTFEGGSVLTSYDREAANRGTYYQWVKEGGAWRRVGRP
jgi:hypothetical protein